MLKQINAIILAKSLVKAQTTLGKAEIHHSPLSEEFIVDRSKEQLLDRLFTEIKKNNLNSIETIDLPNEIKFEIELLVFSKATFKNAVEFVIQELSMERIYEIKNQK